MRKVDYQKQIKCVWCGKLFTKTGDMSCGATVPKHMASGEDGKWCRTDDIKKLFENADGKASA